ncbi:MAG: hypothetical protein JOZ22_12500 [Acidobacteriia bacterium]|nr:hypothetical protein [Terriglobia bacterium]
MGKQTVKAGVLYFALVFGTGFVLGLIRTLWVLPKVGPRIAELMEMPIMFVVIVLAARWVVRHFSSAHALSIGLMALGFLLFAELAVAFWFRHLTPAEYIASRDPVAGTVYALLLGVFAIMPALLARRQAAWRAES